MGGLPGLLPAKQQRYQGGEGESANSLRTEAYCSRKLALIRPVLRRDYVPFLLRETAVKAGVRAL